ILRQAEVVGLLYLENNALPGAFTPGHLAVLELLAAQAAISLDNASLLERERSALVQAREAIELRDDFLRVASHELRTPLASLLPSLQMLHRRCAKGPVDTATLAKQLDNNLRQGQRLRRLVDELFDTTRIARGELKLECSDVDLSELARE